jgi:NADPH:quinone reductase-like Zn-dependent oxidoreductase
MPFPVQKAQTMKAAVQDTYGSPDVLRLDDVPIPTPRDDEVLVKVHAASVNAGDRHLMRGTPFLVRLMRGGVRRPAHRGPGVDVAGRVEGAGRAVDDFQPGDAVFGDLSGHGFGGFAEYVCAPASAFVPLPARLSFEEAAAVPVAGVAALQGLRDEGHIQAGDAVLVNGASGGVGTFAVQLARAVGATVTGVCRRGKRGLVRSVGAHRVIDYTREDVTKRDERYDLILDTAAHRSPRVYRRVLAPGGVYVMVGGSVGRLVQTMLLRPWVARTSDHRLATLMATPNRDDLRRLAEQVEDGAVTPVIDRLFPLSDVPQALRYVEEGRARGKVVVTM